MVLVAAIVSPLGVEVASAVGGIILLTPVTAVAAVVVTQTTHNLRSQTMMDGFMTI